MHDRRDQDADRARGLAMLATIVFFVIAGAGVGVFYEAGLAGALIGDAIGIAVGFWIVPRLIEEGAR